MCREICPARLHDICFLCGVSIKFDSLFPFHPADTDKLKNGAPYGIIVASMTALCEFLAIVTSQNGPYQDSTQVHPSGQFTMESTDKPMWAPLISDGPHIQMLDSEQNKTNI